MFNPHDSSCTGKLAIVTIGNADRGWDGLALLVAEGMKDDPDMKDACFFDLGPYQMWIGKCLQGHRNAVVMDAAQSEAFVRRQPIFVDLSNVQAGPRMRLSHGFSLVDEIRVAKSNAHPSEWPQRVLLCALPVPPDAASSEGEGDDVDIDRDKLRAEMQAEADRLRVPILRFLKRILKSKDSGGCC